jgi:tetratricopeptide (TPR) repeat protein
VRTRSSTRRGRAEVAARAVNGWKLAVPLLLVLLWAMAGQWQRTRARLTASRELLRIEADALEAARQAALPRELLQSQIEVLRALGPLDPSEFGIPLAIGSHFLLLGSSSSAIRWYEQALRLETRPEILFNLARAQALAGNVELSAEYLEQARRLDPLRFAGEEPPAAHAASSPAEPATKGG